MFTIEPKGRMFALYFNEELIAICVYKKGAENVKRILIELNFRGTKAPDEQKGESPLRKSPPRD